MGATCGAALGYFLDPARGHRRRIRTLEKSRSIGRWWWNQVRKSARRTQNRLLGLKSEILQASTTAVDDDTLAARVRSALGHKVHHAHSIHTDVSEGVVTLSGPVALDEVDELLDCVSAVRGVKQVISQLDVENPPGNGYLQ